MIVERALTCVLAVAKLTRCSSMILSMSLILIMCLLSRCFVVAVVEILLLVVVVVVR